MKKLLKITGITTAVLIVIAAFLTSSNNHTPYFESHYFTESLQRLDENKEKIVSTSDSLQAGFSKLSLTPNFTHPNQPDYIENVPLAGYGARKGKAATGIHDSVFVKAIAIKSGSNLIVGVTGGILIMPPNVIDLVEKELPNYGLTREQIFFSATHTHSSIGGWGPGLIGGQFAGTFEPKLVEWLTQQITSAIVLAINDLQPAAMGYGTFEAGNFTRNRLVGKLGVTNNDFDFIRFRQASGREAVMGVFSAHTTVLGADNLEISGDYAGYWERKTEQQTGAMALFFAGSMGSQSPVGEGHGFERAQYIGESLADSLLKYYPMTKLCHTPKIASVSLKMDMPDYKIRITPHIGLSSMVSRKMMPFPMNVYLQAIRFNDLIWITTPADFSGEFGREIKNNLAAEGFHATVTGFNGTYVGYVIPGKYYFIDGYEPKTMGWFGPTMGDYTMHLIYDMGRTITQID